MKTLAWFCVSFLLAMNCFGDVVHDEAVDGDLSDDNLAPTPVAFALGSNEIYGSTTFAPLDRDFWTVVIARGIPVGLDHIAELRCRLAPRSILVGRRIRSASFVNYGRLGAAGHGDDWTKRWFTARRRRVG